ncbi:Nucleoporin Nup54 alpha-helical domain-containing protein [Plasmodiophora brassicae]
MFGGGGFGSTTPAPTPGLFGGGGGGAAGAAPSGTAPSLFGGSTAAAPSTGSTLFGASTTAPGFAGATAAAAPAPTGTTSLFGTSAPATTSFGAGGTTFGAAPAASTGQMSTAPGFFGTSSGNPFGQGTSGGGMFGQAPSGGMFGQGTTSAGGLFPTQTQTQQQTASLFGAPAASSSLSVLPGALTIAGQQQPQQQQQQQQQAWEREVRSIVEAYDPNNPSCRFQFVLYNKVDDASVYDPAPAFRIHPGLYQQAVRENPDPAKLVPVPALGFDALNQRIAQQSLARSHHAKELEICRERINVLDQEYECIKKVTIPGYRQRHADLSLRLLRIARALDMQQGRGFPRSDGELRLSKELDALERSCEKLRVSVEGIASSVPMHESGDHVLDMFRLNSSDPNYKRIYEFLDQQRRSLRHLIDLLHSDTRDVNIMVKGYTAKLNPDRVAG